MESVGSRRCERFALRGDESAIIGFEKCEFGKSVNFGFPDLLLYIRVGGVHWSVLSKRLCVQVD